MNNKKTIYVSLILISVGYLAYYYLFTDRAFTMMHHHYYYYNQSTRTTYLLQGLLRFIAYMNISIFSLLLFIDYIKPKREYLDILNLRLSKGEISVEEFRELKNEIES